MFIKTSSVLAKEYFEIITNPNFDDSFVVQDQTITSKELTSFICYSHDIFAQDISGLATIWVTESLDIKPKAFVIQNLIKIPKHLYFCITANSVNPVVKTYIPLKASFTTTRKDFDISINIIKSDFSILEIFTIFYLSKNTDYSSPINKHEYFELTYVENGTLNMTINNQSYILLENSLLLAIPGQEHSFKADDKVSFLSIMFTMDKTDTTNIANKVFRCTDQMRLLLYQIYQYSDVQNQYHSEMLINLLKTIIIMIDNHKQVTSPSNTISMPKQLYEDETFNEIIFYIQSNIYTAISIKELCKKFAISRSTLQNMFKSNLNTSPKSYINEEKLEISKSLLNQRFKTVSEIANILDYSSVHYFSRAFKKRFGISPSEYALQNK